jgi:hypothetical protein
MGMEPEVLEMVLRYIEKVASHMYDEYGEYLDKLTNMENSAWQMGNVFKEAWESELLRQHQYIESHIKVITREIIEPSKITEVVYLDDEGNEM